MWGASHCVRLSQIFWWTALVYSIASATIVQAFLECAIFLPCQLQRALQADCTRILAMLLQPGTVQLRCRSGLMRACTDSVELSGQQLTSLSWSTCCWRRAGSITHPTVVVHGTAEYSPSLLENTMPPLPKFDYKHVQVLSPWHPCWPFTHTLNASLVVVTGEGLSTLTFLGRMQSVEGTVVITGPKLTGLAGLENLHVRNSTARRIRNR